MYTSSEFDPKPKSYPHALEDDQRVRTAAVEQEQLEQSELRARQLHRIAAAANFARRRVELEIREARTSTARPPSAGAARNAASSSTSANGFTT
jgi:hypothetical protein